jgi:hypothetical protein
MNEHFGPYDGKVGYTVWGVRENPWEKSMLSHPLVLALRHQVRDQILIIKKQSFMSALSFAQTRKLDKKNGEDPE